MNRSKAKGDRFERKIVRIASEMGFDAYRNRMSRAPDGKGHWDVCINGLTFEVKKRKDGFKLIREWLDDNEGVIIGADRDEPLVVLRLVDYLKLLKLE